MAEQYFIRNAKLVGIGYPQKTEYGITRTYNFEYKSDGIQYGLATKSITKTDKRIQDLCKYEQSGFKEGEVLKLYGIYDLRFQKSKFGDKMDLTTIWKKEDPSPEFFNRDNLPF
ncbi:MAG: hypothetical protein MJ232_04615 [archaeon]|nr:hypothetical protein [archaeon]